MDGYLTTARVCVPLAGRKIDKRNQQRHKSGTRAAKAVRFIVSSRDMEWDGPINGFLLFASEPRQISACFVLAASLLRITISGPIVPEDDDTATQIILEKGRGGRMKFNPPAGREKK